jgi:hypothetical protein
MSRERENKTLAVKRKKKLTLVLWWWWLWCDLISYQVEFKKFKSKKGKKKKSRKTNFDSRSIVRRRKEVESNQMGEHKHDA